MILSGCGSGSSENELRRFPSCAVVLSLLEPLAMLPGERSTTARCRAGQWIARKPGENEIHLLTTSMTRRPVLRDIRGCMSSLNSKHDLAQPDRWIQRCFCILHILVEHNHDTQIQDWLADCSRRHRRLRRGKFIRRVAGAGRCIRERSYQKVWRRPSSQLGHLAVFECES